MQLFDSQLEEDDVVVLSKFGVGEKKDIYRVVGHQFKIIFYHCTTVKHVKGWEGVEYGFNFLPFKEILSGEAKNLFNIGLYFIF